MDRNGIETVRGYLADYLRQRGINPRKPFRCLNPQHEDKHPSMSYNAKLNNIHCFACGASYDIFDVVGMDYQLDDFASQCRKACELFELEPPKPQYVKEENTFDITEKENYYTEVIQSLREHAAKEHPYLTGRGISDDSCSKYGFFEHENRAYLPIYQTGECVGWCARAVDSSLRPRYKNSSGPIGLWNRDCFTSSSCGSLLFITEGILDAVCLEQLGESAIALCGSRNVRKLLALCEEYPTHANHWHFIACGDGDDAGQAMNRSLVDGLQRLGLSCKSLELKDKEDINQIYLDNPEILQQKIQEMKSGYMLRPASSWINEFFSSRRNHSLNRGISTGFSAVDKLLDGGLFPGFYVIGAISSIGKTSLALQIADKISQNNTSVLFISLEQSRFELMAKSLSRESYCQAGEKKAFTARQLLSGTQTVSRERQQFLEEICLSYSSKANQLFLIEGMADIGTREIRESVRNHTTASGDRPVVIIDYLQILRPEDPRSSDKQNTDRAVVELKRISRDFDIPVIALSSFNRENYRAAVSMEAFKESGAVEYSSDVLFGMQLAGVGNKNFDVNLAKSKDPRRVELVMLKNRNGIPYAKVTFDYYARFNLFEEVLPVHKSKLDLNQFEFR